MAKFKLVDNGTNDTEKRIESVTKQKYDNKKAARRAATEANVQQYVDVEAVKSSKKKD